MLFEFCDDSVQRWMTTFNVLDGETMICSDMFENISVLRLPEGCEENAEDDPTAS